MCAELATATVAGAELRKLKIFQERFHGCSGDIRRLHKRTRGISDAVNTTVDVVAKRIAGIVLHVTDEDVLPVNHIERAVRGELEIRRTEVSVGGFHEIVAEGGLVAGAVIDDGVLF